MSLIRPDQIRTPWHEFWRRFHRQYMAMTAALFVILLIVVAIFTYWIAPYNIESYSDYDNLDNGPSLQHWSGVDLLGRDTFSRVLVGVQILLTAGVLVTFTDTAIGTLLGLLTGYYEGWWDRLIMRICDVLFAFPGILLTIAVVTVLGSGIVNVAIAVATFSISAFARLMCDSTLVLKQQTFIRSACSIGASNMVILLRHILLGTVSSIVVFFTICIGTSTVSAASLSFLGFSAQPSAPEWGTIFSEAQTDMVIAPHIAALPALAIFPTVLVFNLLGDGLHDVLDPKIEGQLCSNITWKGNHLTGNYYPKQVLQLFANFVESSSLVKRPQ